MDLKINARIVGVLLIFSSNFQESKYGDFPKCQAVFFPVIFLEVK